jgi:hypothetical protein
MGEETEVVEEETPAEPSPDRNALDEMLAGLEGAPKAEEAPAEPAAASAAEVEEEAEVEAPAAPAPAEPVTPDVPKPETPVEKAMRENNELRALLNEMAGGRGLPSGVVSPPAVVAPDVSSPPAAVAVPSTSQEQGDIIKLFNESMKKDTEFLTKEELDNIVDNPALILKALNDARRKTAEEVVTIVPGLLQGIVKQQIDAYRTAEDFYEVNKDLNPYREFVSHIYTKMRYSLKDKTSEEVLTATATEARKHLRLAAPAPAAPAVPRTPKLGARQPSFAKSKGTPRQPAAKGSPGAEKTQSDYMIDLLS